jgi:hypothetical protein
MNERIVLPPRFRLKITAFDKRVLCLPPFKGFNDSQLEVLADAPRNVAILFNNVLQVWQNRVFNITEELFMQDKNEEEGLLAQLAFLKFALKNPDFYRPKITITPPLTSPGDSSSTAITMQLQSHPTSSVPANLRFIANEHQEGNKKILTLMGVCLELDDSKSQVILSNIEQAVRLMGNSLHSDS